MLFRRVHGRYAQYYSARYRRSGHLWQGRIFSCPLSQEHLEVALRYVEFNPVQAGMVWNAIDYRWSSAATHYNGLAESEDLLDAEFWKVRGGTEVWKAVLARTHSEVLDVHQGAGAVGEGATLARIGWATEGGGVRHGVGVVRRALLSG